MVTKGDACGWSTPAGPGGTWSTVAIVAPARRAGAGPLRPEPAEDDPLDHSDARRFAESWAAAWNSHDLDRILNHFTDDVVFHSPVAARIVAGSDGIVRGMDALRAYWAEGLRLLPDLHFEVLEVYVGLNTVVINYRNQAGQLVNEMLTFDGERVSAGHAAYGPAPG